MFAEADYETTVQAMNYGKAGEDEKGLLVKFYLRSTQNPAKSAEAGRPIFEEVEYVTIMVPGDRDNVIDRPIQESDVQRFRGAYMRFKQGAEIQSPGTPLAAWPGITRAQVDELKYFNVETVEQLASMGDEPAQKFAGINELRRRAKAFLEASEDNAKVEKMEYELQQRDEKIALLEARLEQLEAALQEDDD